MSVLNFASPHVTHAVRVPCSTSNLGPGFDLLGLALSLWLDVRVTPLLSPQNEGHTLSLGDDFTSHWPLQENLVVRAFDAVFAASGLIAPACHFAVQSQIPVARGLGSSGAAVAAGLLLARHMIEANPTQPIHVSMETIHGIGIEIEGHPDNVTASLFGGCTLCLPAVTSGIGQHPIGLVHSPLSSSLGFSVAWTDAKLTTDEARSCLPQSVTFEDAVENPRRLAMLLEGLRTGDAKLLALGAEDRLHHRFRLPLIPGGDQALQAANEAGAWMVAINGSGSSLLAIGPIPRAEALAKIMAKTLHEFAPNAVAYTLDAVHGAPKVTSTPA